MEAGLADGWLPLLRCWIAGMRDVERLIEVFNHEGEVKMKNQKGFAAIELVSVVLVLALVGGWVANIYKVCAADWAHLSGLLIMRVIGVFLAPVGAVLGFF